MNHAVRVLVCGTMILSAVLAVLVVCIAPGAAADSPPPSVSWDKNEAVSRDTSTEKEGGSGAITDTTSDVVQAPPPPASKISYTYERVCLQGVGSFLDPAECVRVNSICTAAEDGDLVEWIEIDSSTDPPTETPTGRTTCIYPGQPTPEPPGGGEVIDPPVVITLEDFQSQPIIAAEVVSEPKNFGLLGGHNNVWANVEEQEFNFETLGDEVRIRAWPVEYVWNYGDGTSKSTTTAGNSVPEEEWLMAETPTSHVYGETGDYNLVLTTRFSGDYSVNGGPWIPIAGQAEVQSEPHLMSIWRSDNRLVDGTCKDNPNAWGCK